MMMIIIITITITIIDDIKSRAKVKTAHARVDVRAIRQTVMTCKDARYYQHFIKCTKTLIKPMLSVRTQRALAPRG